MSALLVFGNTVAWAGTLSLGEPTVENGQYVFPVVMRGESNVASLNFTLEYDANVFEPVSAEPGIQALRASKQVAANTATPGEYIVVVLGLNQTALASGEVARLALQPIGTPTGQTRLDLVETSFASWEGPEIPSKGTGRGLSFDAAESEDSRVKEESPKDATAVKDHPEARRGRRTVWTIAEGAGTLRPVVLTASREGEVGTKGSAPAQRNEPADMTSVDEIKSTSQAGGPETSVRISDLTSPVKKSIVETESNRVSTHDVVDTSAHAGGTVGYATPGWTRWSYLALGAVAAVIVALLRRKLFG